VSEGLGQRKRVVSSATVPHLNANSRSSDWFSLKRDERERKLKSLAQARYFAQNIPGTGHSRPGEPRLT